ncbi:hypothetical protein BZA77DRAFT_304687 [Pyronema omphalodes]|nr:hypothetical protein BZA77DRAFT_304687 [Pyronema omphalodes]
MCFFIHHNVLSWFWGMLCTRFPSVVYSLLSCPEVLSPSSFPYQFLRPLLTYLLLLTPVTPFFLPVHCKY